MEVIKNSEKIYVGNACIYDADKIKQDQIDKELIKNRLDLHDLNLANIPDTVKPLIEPVYSDPSFNWDTMTGNYLSKLTQIFNKVKADNIGIAVFVKNILDRNDYDGRTGGAIPIGADVNKWLQNKNELLYLSSGDLIVLVKNSILNLANIRGFILRTKNAKAYETENGKVEGSDGVMTAWDKFQVNDLPAFKNHVNNNLYKIWNDIDLLKFSVTVDLSDVDITYIPGIYKIDKHPNYDLLIVYPPIDYTNGYLDIRQELIYSDNYSHIVCKVYRYISRRKRDGYINLNNANWFPMQASGLNKEINIIGNYNINFGILSGPGVGELIGMDGTNGTIMSDSERNVMIGMFIIDQEFPVIVLLSENGAIAINYDFGIIKENVDGTEAFALFDSDYITEDEIDNIISETPIPVTLQLDPSEDRKNKIRTCLKKMKENPINLKNIKP